MVFLFNSASFIFDFYFNKLAVDVETSKDDIESKVDDIINSLDFLSSYAEIGINTQNIAQSITNVKKFGNYFYHESIYQI